MDVILTDFEIALFDSITFPPDAEALEAEPAANNAELARILAVSLLDRGAVPAHRLAFFFDAAHNVGKPESVRAGLEQGDVSGDRVYEQAAFLKYLRYFICGPELPEKVERAFRRELGDPDGNKVNRSDHRRLVAKIRELARTLGTSDEQREKFYQLALEFGLESAAARDISDAMAPVT